MLVQLYLELGYFAAVNLVAFILMLSLIHI